MSQQAKQIVILPALLMIAGLSMGNQSCEQAKTRVLKMDVELGNLKGRPIRMPNGELVDFPFAVNQHFYRQVMNNDHFAIINPVPSPLTVPNKATAAKIAAKAQRDEAAAVLEPGEVSPRDLQLLNKFGFTHQLFEKSEALAAGSSKTMLPTGAPFAACLYDMPQAQLGGDILSFEASWGVGLGIGYNPNGTLNSGGVGGSVDFSQSRLELGLLTVDPLTGQGQVTGDGVSHQSNTRFTFDFVPGVPVGLSFFFQESLSNTIRQGLDRALDEIVAKYVAKKGTWDNAWESRVIFDPEIANNDTHFAIRGGDNSNIVIGDEFTITNMRYEWKGAECESLLKYKIPLSGQPSIDIKIIEVGDNVAVGVLKDPASVPNVTIIPGAQVKILKLYQPPQTTKDGTKAQGATTAQNLN